MLIFKLILIYYIWIKYTTLINKHKYVIIIVTYVTNKFHKCIFMYNYYYKIQKITCIMIDL